MLRSFRGQSVYLLFYAANAAVLPMLTLYYESLGVEGARLGVLTAIWPAAAIVGASLWGALADGTGRHRLVLSLSMVSSIAAAQLLLLGTGFLSLVPIVALFAITVAPVAPLIDNAVLEDLGENHARYGRMRLWGAVGWGVTSPLFGILVDRAGLPIMFPLYGVLMLAVLGVSFALPVSRGGARTHVLSGFATIAADPRWRVFLITTFIAGTGSTMVYQYLFVYLASIGGNGALRGIALAVSTLSEVVIFGLGDRILRRVRPHALILIAMAGIGVRLVLMGWISDPWVALAPQLFNGVTYSLLIVAGVAIARALAPEGMRASAQALFTATYSGAAGIAGALLGGILYRSMPIQSVFLVVGAAELAIAPVLFLIGRREPQTA